MYAVQTTIAPIQKLILNKLKLWDPNLHWVYDPSLTYSSAISGLRTLNTNIDIKPTTVFPLLAFNRDTLQLQPGKRKLSRSTNPLYKIGDTLYSYVESLSEFTMKFVYFHSDFSEIERFEVLYSAYQAINDTMRATLVLEDIGSLLYDLWWSDLDRECIVSAFRDGYYKGVSGSVTVKGPFLALIGEQKLIKHITLQLAEDNGLDDENPLLATYKWEAIYPIDVDPDDDTIAVINQWETTTRVRIVKTDDADVLPTPLDETKNYFTIPVTTNSIKLATTLANAKAGIAIDITDDGSVESGSYFKLRVKL